VEHIGSEFGIILNNPELRDGFVAEAERAQRAQQARVQLRVRLANALHALAIRIEPHVAQGSEPAPSPSQPVFAD
jgi:hypothetical protein